jgi:archaellum component FlaC
LELQQKKSSKAERVSPSFTNKFPLTKPFAEKYLKKLIGKNDIEDALKRLDRLTQEARMAAAQLPKVTNTIDNRAGGIADNMLVVDNRVGGIDARVAGGDERVTGIDDRVACVDDRVEDVADKVKAVNDKKLVADIDGAQYIFNQSSKIV